MGTTTSKTKHNLDERKRALALALVGQSNDPLALRHTLDDLDHRYGLRIQFDADDTPIDTSSCRGLSTRCLAAINGLDEAHFNAMQELICGRAAIDNEGEGEAKAAPGEGEAKAHDSILMLRAEDAWHDEHVRGLRDIDDAVAIRLWTSIRDGVIALVRGFRSEAFTHESDQRECIDMLKAPPPGVEGGNMELAPRTKRTILHLFTMIKRPVTVSNEAWVNVREQIEHAMFGAAAAPSSVDIATTVNALIVLETSTWVYQTSVYRSTSPLRDLKQEVNKTIGHLSSPSVEETVITKRLAATLILILQSIPPSSLSSKHVAHWVPRLRRVSSMAELNKELVELSEMMNNTLGGRMWSAFARTTASNRWLNDAFAIVFYIGALLAGPIATLIKDTAASIKDSLDALTQDILDVARARVGKVLNFLEPIMRLAKAGVDLLPFSGSDVIKLLGKVLGNAAMSIVSTLRRNAPSLRQLYDKLVWAVKALKTLFEALGEWMGVDTVEAFKRTMKQVWTITKWSLEAAYMNDLFSWANISTYLNTGMLTSAVNWGILSSSTALNINAALSGFDCLQVISMQDTVGSVGKLLGAIKALSPPLNLVIDVIGSVLAFMPDTPGMPDLRRFIGIGLLLSTSRAWTPTSVICILIVNCIRFLGMDRVKSVLVPVLEKAVNLASKLPKAARSVTARVIEKIAMVPFKMRGITFHMRAAMALVDLVGGREEASFPTSLEDEAAGVRAQLHSLLKAFVEEKMVRPEWLEARGEAWMAAVDAVREPETAMVLLRELYVKGLTMRGSPKGAWIRSPENGVWLLDTAAGFATMRFVKTMIFKLAVNVAPSVWNTTVSSMKKGYHYSIRLSRRWAATMSREAFTHRARLACKRLLLLQCLPVEQQGSLAMRAAEVDVNYYRKWLPFMMIDFGRAVWDHSCRDVIGHIEDHEAALCTVETLRGTRTLRSVEEELAADVGEDIVVAASAARAGNVCRRLNKVQPKELKGVSLPQMGSSHLVYVPLADGQPLSDRHEIPCGVLQAVLGVGCERRQLRRWMLVNHPDKGGDARTFRDLHKRLQNCVEGCN